MVRIGVISNAHSKRNKVSMREIHQLLDEHPQVKHHSFHHINELPGCLAEMASAGVTHLVISGGDGTVLATVSALLNNSPFAEQPCLSLLSAGMMWVATPTQFYVVRFQQGMGHWPDGRDDRHLRFTVTEGQGELVLDSLWR